MTVTAVHDCNRGTLLQLRRFRRTRDDVRDYYALAAEAELCVRVSRD